MNMLQFNKPIVNKPENKANTAPGRGRRTTVAALGMLAMLAILVSAPAAVVMSQDVDVQLLLERLKVLERRVMRLASLADHRPPQKISLCGQDIPLARQDIREAFEMEFYISLSSHASTILWMKRSGTYFPYIERKLRERGLPDDLKYLAVAESDLKQYAYSPAGAAGIWQFIESTGRSYGLRVDTNIDERRDFVKSTDSALTFLSRLNGMFNDWLLAMASYNAGPGRIIEAKKKQNVISYFDMDLPRETERYIYRIAAIKTIMSQPEQYGLDIPPDAKYPAYDLETMSINVPVKSVGIMEIADASGLTYKQIRELNLHFMGSSLPKGHHSLNLPKSKVPEFAAAWTEKFKNGVEEKKVVPTPTVAPSTQLPQGNGEKKKVVYVVKQGDTLSSIARKNGVSLDQIRKWNNLKHTDVLKFGTKIILYK